MRVLPLPSFLFVFVALVGCAPKFQAVEDWEAINSMFSDFKPALRTRNGKKAVQSVSQNSIERYEQYQEWALNSSEEEIASLTLAEQIETRRLRKFFPPEELSKLTGKEIIAALVNKDCLDVPFVKEALLAEPVFMDQKCYVHIHDDAGSAKEKLTFVKEEDGWKIDISALEEVQDKIYRGMMRREKKSAAEVVQVIVDSWEPKTTPPADSLPPQSES